MKTKTIHQNLWDEVKAVFKGKFITIYAHIFKKTSNLF